VTERIAVVSDTQMPFEDKRAVRSILNFVRDYQPDRVVQIGDLADFPQPSRWNKDTAGEFQGSVFKDAEYIKRNFLGPLRDVYDGPVTVMEGNHDLRPKHYLAKYAPALAESRAFDLDVLLDFNGFGVELIEDFYDFAPGWTITHGHVGKIPLRQSAGSTALAGAQKFGKSLIMGHTHRLGAVSHTRGYGGRVTQVLTGVEVGHLMNMKNAKYLNGATGNWQQGFAVVTVDGAHVTPTLVPITKGKFSVDGVVYKV
jgi:metallophosphoesterase superfamily enzyme